MTVNIDGESQTLIEDQQANIKTLTELNLNQARTIENLQAQVKELEAESGRRMNIITAQQKEVGRLTDAIRTTDNVQALRNLLATHSSPTGGE